jgi:hypothetical protein
LPNQGVAVNYTICNDLKILQTSKLLIATSSLDVMGNIEKDINAGFTTTGNWTRLIGSNDQVVSGDFTGVNQFWSFRVQKPNGDITFDSNVDVYGNNLRLFGGIIRTRPNTLKHVLTGANVSPANGTSNTFIDGRYARNMTLSSSFSFPIGYQNTWKPTSLFNVSVAGYWEVDYARESVTDTRS